MLTIHPKEDTNDRDTIRTFMVLEGGKSLYSGRKPLVWEIRRASGGGEHHDWELAPRGAIDAVERNHAVIRLSTAGLPAGTYEIRARNVGGRPRAECKPDEEAEADSNGVDSDIAVFTAYDISNATFVKLEGGALPGPPPPASPPVAVSLTSGYVPPTRDEILWVAIRASTNQLRFKEFKNFVDPLFARWTPGGRSRAHLGKVDARSLMDLDSETAWLISSHGPYSFLKRATEVFVMSRCGVIPGDAPLLPSLLEEEGRFGHQLPGTFRDMWKSYLTPIASSGAEQPLILPYLDLIRRKLGDVGGPRAAMEHLTSDQLGLLQEKLVYPCMIELIWSYWHEEGMLVQTCNAVAQRFQNVRSGSGRDPLAQLEIDPLRPLNQLLWGFVQDESNRLSVRRRAHEYEHHYGFTVEGKATENLRSVDRRSKFLESFHNLLRACQEFFDQDDDTTVRANAFLVLNGIKETHYVLSHGAHNQFADLPATARVEMLVQQYILARPEMREFLGGRVMVPYPEEWMDRVDTVKNLKGWHDVSAVHFRDLGVFGEQLLLSVRYGGWSMVDDPNSAANWARYWRAEIQGYMHAYRAVTGVDINTEPAYRRRADERNLPPSVHLKNRLLSQVGK